MVRPPVHPIGRRRTRRRAVLRLAAALLAVAAVVAATATAAGAGLSSALRGLDAREESLPAPLLAPSPSQVTRVYAADGRTLVTTFYDEDRHDISLTDVAPVMRQAIVAAEDTRFFQHGGVDLRGVARALVDDGRSGHAEQGASTLTMQYVRNVLKEDPTLSGADRAAATADTPARKLREAQYAIGVEHHLTKAQILQNYLNIVYFGAGAYGVDAAARAFFGTSPGRLSLAQAALLAGVVQSPDADNPLTGDPAAARARQRYVLQAMLRGGTITASQAATAAAAPVAVHPAPRPNGCTEATADRGFFCDYVHTWWDAQPAFGATPAARDLALRRGGYTVVTSMDPHTERVANAEARSVYADGNRRALPIAVVQPGTGRVLALAVNRHFGLGAAAGHRRGDTVNQLVAGGGGVAGYPAGSTFKMFTMLAALEAGLPLATSFDAPAQLRTRWPDGGPRSCAGRYCPRNANPAYMDGTRTMWNGFGRSVNTYFVWLEEQIGPAAAVAMAQRLGISLSAPSDARLAADSPDSWGAFTLGVADTTPLELAGAYAAVAADGRYCTPLPVRSVTDAAGHPLPVGTPHCTQVLAPDVAHAATDAARCPVGQQSAFARCDGGTAAPVSALFGGRDVAGKTGSTDDNTTETFVGFTTTAVAAGIAADPDDPGDRVGSAAAPRVNRAVARTLLAAVGDGRYPDFTPPTARAAYGD